MSVNVKVDASKFQAKIRAMAAVLGKPLVEVLDSAARGVAISCARTSQPFGTGADAQTVGQKAVGRDIGLVYRTAGNAYDDIANPRYKKIFWKAFQAGEFDVAQAALNQYGSKLAGVPIEPFDGGAAHSVAHKANSRGLVKLNTPKMVVTKWSELASYVNTIKDRVGFGKGGWADVARQLGSIRGLRDEGDITANWITRKASGLGRFARGGAEDHPTITISSTVSYASEILQGGALNDAIQIAGDKTISNLEERVRGEMRKLKTAA